MESLSHREAKGAAQGHSQVHSQMNPGPSPKAVSSLLGAHLPSLDLLTHQHWKKHMLQKQLRVRTEWVSVPGQGKVDTWGRESERC